MPVIIHPITNEFIKEIKNGMELARIVYTAPNELEITDLDRIINYELTDTCGICLETFTLMSDVRKLPCGHCYHFECITDAMKHASTCPMCRKTIGKIQGRMPSGTMVVRHISTQCSGYDCATYEMVYSFPNGIQKNYHPNPGKSYSGTTRIAYIPCSPANDVRAGAFLLKRLLFAFESGLTFMVGTSMTSGLTNCITWASIHHKTNLYGSQHGFPDVDYFKNVNEELDNLNVPRFD